MSDKEEIIEISNVPITQDIKSSEKRHLKLDLMAGIIMEERFSGNST